MMPLKMIPKQNGGFEINGDLGVDNMWAIIITTDDRDAYGSVR